EKITAADGQLLDPSVLDLDARKIASAYSDEGYAAARVTPHVDPAGAGLVSVRFDIVEGSKQKVRKIVIHGAHTLPDAKLADAMAALRLYMRSRGYRDAEVDSIRPADLPDAKGVELHVYLREGPRYRFGTLTWSGNTSVPTAALELANLCVPGEPYNESQV